MAYPVILYPGGNPFSPFTSVDGNTGDTAPGLVQPNDPFAYSSKSLFSDNSIKDQYYANSALQEQAQNFSAAEAEKERQWSERMSNTSYQRAMEDIAKTGYNPLLALQGVGASSFSGAAASSSGASVSKGSDQFSNFMKTAVSASAIVKILKALIK